MQKLNNNKKIAQVVCHLPPDAGGIGMVAHSYADKLAKRGYDVSVFVPQGKKDIAKDKRYKVVYLKTFIKSGLGAFVPQLIFKLRKFDIVHLHYPFFGAAGFVALLKMFKKTKQQLVLSYHQDVHLTGWQGLYERTTRKLFLRKILQL